jgi:Glycosyl transferases group 1
VRIAYVTESFPPDVNGVAHTAVRVVEQLARRGHEMLVIAPEPARGRPRPDGVRLVIVGSGPAEAAARRALPGAVFLGQRGGDELARIYASLDVFAHSGPHATFGQTLQEAAARGPGPRRAAGGAQPRLAGPVRGAARPLPGRAGRAAGRPRRRARLTTADSRGHGPDLGGSLPPIGAGHAASAPQCARRAIRSRSPGNTRISKVAYQRAG